MFKTAALSRQNCPRFFFIAAIPTPAEIISGTNARNSRRRIPNSDQLC